MRLVMFKIVTSGRSDVMGFTVKASIFDLLSSISSRE